MSEAAARAALLLAVGLVALGARPPADVAPACVAPRAGEAAPLRPATVACGAVGDTAEVLPGALPLLFGGRVDLNRAASGALEALPGIGPKRAAAIERARFQRSFCSVDELQRVHGIGPATVAGLAPLTAARCAED